MLRGLIIAPFDGPGAQTGILRSQPRVESLREMSRLPTMTTHGRMRAHLVK